MILLGLMLVFTFVQAAIAKLMSGGGPLDLNMESPVAVYMLLAGGTVCTFLLPVLTLQYIEKYFTYFPQEQRVGKMVYLIVFLFLLAFSPMMQVVGEWNANMSLPESLKSIEEWMKEQEDSMAALTAKIVMVDSVQLLLVNILVMAVLPAIAEEFFFRGALMHIVQRMVKNHHLTIWITAIIFSAIHIQFYGFFPRMLLGAFFGYMLVWTQNIWVPVVGHFINNASVTILAFYYANQGKTFADMQTYESYPIFVYIGGIVLTIVIGYWFYHYTNKRNRLYGARLD